MIDMARTLDAHCETNFANRRRHPFIDTRNEKRIDLALQALFWKIIHTLPPFISSTRMFALTRIGTLFQKAYYICTQKTSDSSNIPAKTLNNAKTSECSEEQRVLST